MFLPQSNRAWPWPALFRAGPFVEQAPPDRDHESVTAGRSIHLRLAQLSKDKRMICATAAYWNRGLRGRAGGWPALGGSRANESRIYCTIGLALAGLVAGAGAAQAQLVKADVGIDPTFQQTDPTTVTATGGFFSAGAFVNSASDFSGGTLTYRGSGSPQPLSFVPGDIAWEFQTPGAPLPELKNSFRLGDYTFNLTGGAFIGLGVVARRRAATAVA